MKFVDQRGHTHRDLQPRLLSRTSRARFSGSDCPAVTAATWRAPQVLLATGIGVDQQQPVVRQDQRTRGKAGFEAGHGPQGCAGKPHLSSLAATPIAEPRGAISAEASHGPYRNRPAGLALLGGQAPSFWRSQGSWPGSSRAPPSIPSRRWSILNPRNRDTAAMQLKLDEGIRATAGAHDALPDLVVRDEKLLDGFRARQGQRAHRRRLGGTGPVRHRFARTTGRGNSNT